MNSLIFRKGALIEKELKKNIWIMHFRNMSGDGDHYEVEKLELEDTSKFLDYIMIYATRWLNIGVIDIYNDNEILKAAESKAVELKLKENGYDLYMDLTGPDITNDQYQASPQECWITYFDEHGYEHLVEFVNGDKVFQRINESDIKEVLNED